MSMRNCDSRTNSLIEHFHLVRTSVDGEAEDTVPKLRNDESEVDQHVFNPHTLEGVEKIEENFVNLRRISAR